MSIADDIRYAAGDVRDGVCCLIPCEDLHEWADALEQAELERDELRSRCAVQRQEIDSYAGRRTRQTEELRRVIVERDSANAARIAALTTLRRLYEATEDECGGFFLSDPGPWGEARDEALRVLTTATKEVGGG